VKFGGITRKASQRWTKIDRWRVEFGVEMIQGNQVRRTPWRKAEVAKPKPRSKTKEVKCTISPICGDGQWWYPGAFQSLTTLFYSMASATSLTKSANIVLRGSHASHRLSGTVCFSLINFFFSFYAFFELQPWRLPPFALHGCMLRCLLALSSGGIRLGFGGAWVWEQERTRQGSGCATIAGWKDFTPGPSIYKWN
jgi:hypothetical protein